jgi:hypothetical protein
VDRAALPTLLREEFGLVVADTTFPGLDASGAASR